MYQLLSSKAMVTSFVILVSFFSTPKILGEHSYPLESTKHAFPFVVPDYTISTASACIVFYTASGSSPEVSEWVWCGGGVKLLSVNSGFSKSSFVSKLFVVIMCLVLIAGVF